ncbi:MAG: hypothetical protein L3K10_04975 [Thermoplasmata archaeon]|nr:hypothetical protein [Thermoplasmata archaeon]
MQAAIQSQVAPPNANVPPRPANDGSVFHAPPTLEATFEAGTRRGRLRVLLGKVSDFQEAGWDAVFGSKVGSITPAAAATHAGFPALLAHVEPEGRGYQNLLGWIQLVNERDGKGTSLHDGDDPAWFLQGRDVPYGAVGYAPSYFDAPSRPGRQAVLWEADLFLCTLPSVPGDHPDDATPIGPLAGIRWGFRIATDGAEPTPLAPRLTGDWAWASWVPVLRKRFPTWRFADRTPSVGLGTPRRA